MTTTLHFKQIATINYQLLSSTELGAIPGLRGEKPATNHQSYTTAFVYTRTFT
jgi:hypothetical protein